MQIEREDYHVGLEDTMRGMICGFGLSSVLGALHNACCQGDVLVELGYEVSNKQLGKLFDGFDTSMKAARKIDKESGLI